MFKRLTHARFARAGIASAVIAAAVIVAVSAGALSGGTKSQAAAPTSMTVTNPASAAVGSNFVATVVGANPGLVTIGGYSMELGYNPAVVSVVSVADGGGSAPGTCTTGAGNWASPQSSPTVQTGCAFQTLSTAGPWDDDVITFSCVAPGTSTLLLIDKIADPISGTSFFDTNAVDIGTDLFNSSVECVLPFTKTADAGPHLGGGQATFTVHVGNPTAASIPGQIVADQLPAPLTVSSISSTNGALDNCNDMGGGLVLCTSATAQPDPTGFDLTIVADIPVSAAGQTLCNGAQLNPPTGPTAQACINVAPASVTVTKVADATSYQAGDPISWTITVTSNGPSPADGVVVTDTPTDGWVASDPLVYNLGLMAPSTSVNIVINGTVDTPNPSDNTCDNSVAATATNGTGSSDTAAATCLSKNVRMVKSTDGVTAPTNSGGVVNLWLCKQANCGVVNGEGFLDVYEWILNVGGDPDGVGAFEFQLKYDNHIFDITITPTNWLYDTGRVPGAVGVGGCAATIITENDIRFGCVSKNPVDGNGDPVITTGNMANGVAATIHITPKADLANRITPGNDNGAIRTILDEGCEIADIWGHPLSTANGSPNPIDQQLPNDADGDGYDQLLREILVPGVLPGGLIEDCADLTITVRILEGDMNLDCEVDVVDDQIEASHYGAFFGNLLYQPWYDLEPWLKDGDVDIKDLQKVFGRNGSTCANPVPAQPPLPDPDP